MAQSYEKAGVNLEAGYEVVRRIKKHVASTSRLGVMGNIGAFGGMFDLSALGVKEPVLVSGTDGVGTKLKLAFAVDKHDTIGIDAVAMCVNDVLAQGAEPLVFLDYVAVGRNEPRQIEAIVAGVGGGGAAGGEGGAGGGRWGTAAPHGGQRGRGAPVQMGSPGSRQADRLHRGHCLRRRGPAGRQPCRPHRAPLNRKAAAFPLCPPLRPHPVLSRERHSHRTPHSLRPPDCLREALPLRPQHQQAKRLVVHLQGRTHQVQRLPAPHRLAHRCQSYPRQGEGYRRR